MKESILLLTFVMFQFRSLAQYSYQNVKFLSNWYDSTVVPEPYYDAEYNGCWGYTDSSGREYAIIGSTKGTHVIEITDPINSVERDFVPGRRDGCLWREYKTYKNYLYMVSDDQEPNSFQIADLSYLPDSVHLVHDSDSIFARSHTIFVEGDKLFCGSVTGGQFWYMGMAVYSLANPEKPLFLRRIGQDYPGLFSHTHDMFVRNDTVFSSSGYDGLFVFLFDSNNTFQLLGSLTTYAGQGYNHSSHLTDDGKSLVFCDEVPDNLPVKVADVTDLNDIQVIQTFKSNEGATAHNPFIINDFLFIAYYEDGLQVYYVGNPQYPVRTGYFDTYPQNGSVYSNPPYKGAWGAYPFFPSGNVIVSDMQNGLFVLDPKDAMGARQISQRNTGFELFPNPFTEEIFIQVKDRRILNKAIDIEIFDLLGRKVYGVRNFRVSENVQELLPRGKTLNKGMYFVRIAKEKFACTFRLVGGKD